MTENATIKRRTFVDCLVAMNGEFYVSIKGGNGRPVFTSETYTTTQAADEAIDIVFGPDFFKLTNLVTVRVGKIETDYERRVKW